MNRTCTECNINKPISEYHRDSSKPSGYRPKCKDCRKVQSAGYYLENKCSILVRNKKWAKENKEIVNAGQRRRVQRKSYKDKAKAYRQSNREKCNEYTSNWRKRNKKYDQERSARRRAVKLQATLLGFDEELKEIYANCPEGYHVDHIYPLKGKNCCGLHVPWNLQYLPASENLKKSNKMPNEQGGCYPK